VTGRPKAARHLLFADRDPGPPTTATINKLVTTVLADVVQRRPAVGSVLDNDTTH